MVLYGFVAAYVGGFEEPLWDAIPGQWILALLVAGALFVELSIAVLGSGLKSLGSEGAVIPIGLVPGGGRRIAARALPDPVRGGDAVAFLIAAVGAVVLAARRPEPEAGIEGEGGPRWAPPGTSSSAPCCSRSAPAESNPP